MDRRNFLKAGGVVASSWMIEPGQIANILSPLEDNPFSKAMRWAQLAFVENDPANYDPDFWLQYFEKIHADGALLSAGGVTAFYPTNIPLHHRSAFLGDKDPLGYMIAGCRKRGMSVILRTDPHAVRQEVLDAHPEWIAVTPKGDHQRHWADPDLWVTCCLGPYNFEFMSRVHQEIMERYRPDGIFSNRWSGPWAYTGICYCENCDRNFRAFSGMDLPRSNKLFDESTRLDPVYIKYREWSTNRLQELWKVWDNIIRKVKPTARFIPNGFPDKLVIGELSDVVFSDAQFRNGPVPPWANGRGAKELHATMGMKPLMNIFSIAASGPNRWMDSVQTNEEIRIWAADGVANGMRPCFVKFGATVHDNRWMDTLANMYGQYYKHEKYLQNEAPIARVGLVTSDQHFSGGTAAKPWQENNNDHIPGMYHALIERHIPFEMVNPRLMDATRLRPFKLLILSNLTSLSDAQCDQLRKFVEDGGSLIATFETSLYDENNKQRSDFGLSDLFGVSYDNGVEGPMKNSYLRLKGDHAVLKNFGTAGRIINGNYRVKVKPTGSFPSPITLIPSFPDLPMEMVYERVTETDIRELYLRESGSAGRVAYIPWDIERSFWRLMTPDHGRLLGNIVEWALNEAPLLRIDTAGIFDATIWRQRSSMTVHLVNLTNPMMMKPPYRSFIPASATVHLRIPGTVTVKKVQLLMSAKQPAYKIHEGIMTVTVPEIIDHEIIALDI